jgi:hypothetical protein
MPDQPSLELAQVDQTDSRDPVPPDCKLRPSRALAPPGPAAVGSLGMTIVLLFGG